MLEAGEPGSSASEARESEGPQGQVEQALSKAQGAAGQQQQQQQQPGSKGAGFDRLVSRIMRDQAAGKANGGLSGPQPVPSTSSRFRRGMSRGARRLTSGYLRRAVSARFGGGKGAEEEDGSQEGGDKPAPEAGKSGECLLLGYCACSRHVPAGCMAWHRAQTAKACQAMPNLHTFTCNPSLPPAGRLIVAEDRASGSVPWSIYGRFALRMGLPVVCVITGKAAEAAAQGLMRRQALRPLPCAGAPPAILPAAGQGTARGRLGTQPLHCFPPPSPPCSRPAERAGHLPVRRLLAGHVGIQRRGGAAQGVRGGRRHALGCKAGASQLRSLGRPQPGAA